MKILRIRVVETVEYERAYPVADSFDASDNSALEGLWTHDTAGPTEGFVGVTEREITVLNRG